MRLPKPICLIFRFVTSIAIYLLPLAHQYLDSLDIVGILLVELIATTTYELGAHDKTEPTYAAKVSTSKRELEENVKTSLVIDVEELAARQDRTKLTPDRKGTVWAQLQDYWYS
jgi:hypothetical protein